MKKILYSLVALLLCTSLLTGCGSKKSDKKEEPKKEDTNLTDNQDKTDDSEQKVETLDIKNYYCNKRDNENITINLYYLNDELETIEYQYLITDEDEYNSTKTKISEYDGVSIDKTEDNFAKITIDIKQDQLRYVKDNFEIFKDLESTNSKDMVALLKNDYKCSSKIVLETTTGNIK